MASGRAIPAAFSLVCSSCAADLSAAGPTRTRYILFLPLVMGDTDALKPFTRAWRTSRSAFSLLPKTPSCTPQPPDSPLTVAGFSGAAACGLAAGFSATAVRVGLVASARVATEGVGALAFAAAGAEFGWLGFGAAVAVLEGLAAAVEADGLAVVLGSAEVVGVGGAACEV